MWECVRGWKKKINRVGDSGVWTELKKKNQTRARLGSLDQVGKKIKLGRDSGVWPESLNSELGDWTQNSGLGNTWTPKSLPIIHRLKAMFLSEPQNSLHILIFPTLFLTRLKIIFFKTSYLFPKSLPIISRLKVMFSTEPRREILRLIWSWIKLVGKIVKSRDLQFIFCGLISLISCLWWTPATPTF